MRRCVALTAVTGMLVVGLPAVAVADATETVEGELQRLAIERLDGTGLEVAVVVAEDGEAVRVDAEAVEHVETGATVAAEVIPDAQAAEDVLSDDGGVEVADVDVLAAPDQPATGGPTVAGLAAAAAAGNRPVGVVTGTFTGLGNPAVSAATIAADITGYVNPFWADSTGGAIGFTVTTTGSAGTYGNPPATCDTTFILAVLDWSAKAAGMYPTFAQRRHTVLYTPKLPACGFAGVAHVGDGGSAWINGTSNRWPTIAHELGHTLALRHSDSRVLCPGQDGTFTQCHHGEYGDAYDVMGSASSGAAGPLSGAQLDALGLVPAGAMTSTTGGQVTLKPVGGLSGLRFLKFTAGGATYYVEYRAAVGRDADLGSTRRGCPQGVSGCSSTVVYQPGVLVRRVDAVGAGDPTYLLDADPSAGWFALRAGQSFTTADMSTTVRVVSTSTAGAVLSVTVVDTTPKTPFQQIVASPDLTGNRLGDVLAVDRNGRLFLYDGRGGGKIALSQVFGTGWDGLRVFAPGDWNGDGRADVVAADDKGDLWLYPGNGRGGFGAKAKIGNGWNGYRIVPAGDMNGDGTADLLAIDPNHLLWLYPGDGRGSFRKRVQVGNGWNGFELYAAGDANLDGRRDILSIDLSGRLWYYAGRGGGYFWARQQVGWGWTGYAFASGADLNADGYSDLVGRDPDGRLWFYPGRYGGTFGMKTQIGTGW